MAPSLLAGLKGLVGDSGPSTAHGQFIHNTILPLLARLQRELRTRRHKDVQTKLQEAILLVKAFQNEEWPRNSPSTTTVANNGPSTARTVETMDEDEDDNVSVLSEAVTDNGNDLTGSMTTATVPSVGDSFDAEDDEQSIMPTVAEDAIPPAAAQQEQLQQQSSSTSSSEVKKYATMDPAITSLLEALILILSHSHRPSTKGLETALECVQQLVSHRYIVGSAGGADDPAQTMTRKLTDNSEDNFGRKQTQQEQPSVLHRLLEAIAKSAETNAEAVHAAVILTLKTVVTSPVCGIHETSMLLALRSTFHVYLVTKAASCKDAARQALLEILQSVFRRMEAYEAVTKHQAQYRPATSNGRAKTKAEAKAEAANGSHDLPVHVFASQYHSDSYVLFRALCKLSSKELSVEKDGASTAPRLFSSSNQDPLALNSKILSLELILAAFDYCGEAFYNGERFIHLVQHYLCVSLLKNCMSNHTQVAFLSQKIFLVLVYKFKRHLKQEIEVFLSNIFLRVLDSPNSSFKQKALVLESLRSLCQDPSLLTQLFLHYDCDFDAMNLYKDIVHMLTKLAGKTTSNPSRTEQDWELSLGALEVLVTVLKSNLKALGFAVSGDDADDSAGAKIRGMLQLDVGSATAPKMFSTTDDNLSSDSSLPDDISLVDAAGMNGMDVPSSSNTNEAPTTQNQGNGKVAERIVDAFEMKRNAEQNFEIGAVKFTLSLKSGINYFVENGLVRRTAKDVALFFLQHKDKLDKTQMGDALGREPDAAFVKDPEASPEEGGVGFWTLILHHYVNAFDFTDMVFDEAIRLFLSGFRLPGEAQKIDRIMEKFAQRFTEQNPTIFPSPDTAFILAFSVIMLNTDLHNPSIKPEKRMTMEGFKRNNRGIGDNGTDMPAEFLDGIFRRIKERPFSLKEDDAARERAQKQIFDTSVFFEGSTLFGTSTEQKKREIFQKEKDEMMAATEQLIRRRPGERNLTRSTTSDDASFDDDVSPADVVKPIFDVTWGPLLGILSQVLECFDDERSTAVCLNGFVYAVRIAANSNMSLVRDTFMSSLAKFTFLGSIKNMKRKNIESVRTLLSIAVIDGENLGASWEPVLQCISQIARLRLSASGLDSDDTFLSPNRRRSSSASGRDIFRPSTSKEDLARETEESNGKAVLEAVQEVLIDKVFESTVNLSAKTLALFIQQLITVSESEIAGTSKRGITGVDGQRMGQSTHGSDGPSIYSLQRLVDVADFNMDVRPRLVWAQVWEMMANFFAKIACHENANVSVFAIDSLKQLSFKFLDKPELTEFNFQRIFLNPFLVVMEEKSSRDEVREMVLHCIDNMIRTKSHNLRSGWKVVFSILDRSASDPSEKIDFLGLGILQRLLDEHLHEICSLADTVTEDDEVVSPTEARYRNSNVEEFVELCRASLSFVGKKDTDSPRPFGLAMRAFCHTGLYADLLAAKRVLPPVSGAQSRDPYAAGYTYEGLSEKESLEMVPWRALLEGLAEGVKSNVRNVVGGVGCLVQRGSILALRAILLRHGHTFSAAQLAAIIEQTLGPAIQAGAESDQTTVISITSESPAVSSVDFLSESQPLPPPMDDPSLQAFAKDLESSSKRQLGPAELMLEASFTVLRHGGDGDLRKARSLAKKGDDSDRPEEEEQPFPESWLATTAPGALGLLTDIVSEVGLKQESSLREALWPILSKHYRLWYIGTAYGPVSRWNPCEALVRICCREMQTLATRVISRLGDMSVAERQGWCSCILSFFAEIMLQNSIWEEKSRERVLWLRRKMVDQANEVPDAQSTLVGTVYGSGEVLERKLNKYGNEGTYEIQKVQLNFGTLYTSGTALIGNEARDQMRNSINHGHDSVETLKVRSVAAHCTNQILLNVAGNLVPFVSKYVAADVLDSLNKSRMTSSVAAADDELSMAFQEALLSDWGDEVADVQAAIESSESLSQLHGSCAMFFLTQDSGSTQAALSILSRLYNHEPIEGCTEWERESFAESHLFYILNDVLDKFVASEKTDGHLIDPHFWRTAGVTGVKIAVYCTSFASVVLEILSTIESMRPDQFSRHKHDIFPRLCKLIRVRNDEVRDSVHRVFLKQIGPLIHVIQDT